MPDFPNLFTITGPGSPSVLSNMPVSIEQHVEWIGDCLAYLREHGIDTIEARPDATESWTEHVQEASATPCTRRRRPGTWGPTSPASRGCSCPTSAGSVIYRDKCEAVAASGYEGFDLTHAHAAASA